MSDLTTPLGLKTPGSERKKRPFGALVSIVVVALASVVAIWMIAVDDPNGGEPSAVAKIDDINGSVGRSEVAVVGVKSGAGRILEPSIAAEEALAGPGSAGAKPQEEDPRAMPTAPIAALEEDGPHGPLPRISDAGVRPIDAYARPVDGLIEAAPKIAVVVGGIGLSQTGSQEALHQLPAGVTLAFAPYGSSLDRWTARARQDGHEILVQLPMEPFDYPDNDPGPNTLVTGAAAEKNLDNLRWVLARTGTYVGVIGTMGARFTADAAALEPVMREVSNRGLMYVDDGSSLRSRAGLVAAATKAPFAQADVVLDTVASPDEIAGRLAQLEQIARSRGLAVGYASALPVSIRSIAEWSETLDRRGITLVPITVAIGRGAPPSAPAAEAALPAAEATGAVPAEEEAPAADDGGEEHH